MLSRPSPHVVLRKRRSRALLAALTIGVPAMEYAQSPTEPNIQGVQPAASRQASPAPRTQQVPAETPKDGNTPPHASAPVPTSQQPSTAGRHPADTTQGRTPHSSGNGAAIAGAIGAAGAGIVIAELIAHHNTSPDTLGHNGPQLPKQFDMNTFTVKGLVAPSWPVVLDFMLDGPGAVELDIVAADKHQYRVRMTNTPNRRAYAILHLPPDFGSGLQTGVYQVHSIAAPGATTPPPGLRTYGIGAGEKAVGSVAIDQLTFEPAAIHTRAKEVANYSFHAHSTFNGVRAEFIVTTLYNGHLLIERDQEQELPPIPQDERGRGTWNGSGKGGEHMLQIRAWRGLERGGDWVVAWSPDIVEVVK